MTSTVQSVRPSAGTGLPDLWVLSVALEGRPVSLEEMVQQTGVRPDRFVFVSNYSAKYSYLPVTHLRAVGVPRESQLWNWGLQYIADEQGGDLWDVAMVSPQMPMARRWIDNLRHHMRVLDTRIAEADLFGTRIDGGYYQVYNQASLQDIPSPSVVVAGELGARFDTRYTQDADSWAEFCQRNCSSGGSVVLSRNALSGSYYPR